MAAVFKVFAAVFLVVVLLAGVSAETHHVVGDNNGWGPGLDVSSWLSGRVFSVGDKIWFKFSGAEGNIVELKGLEEFLSCNLTNPIRMYTDPVNNVALDKEGVRYFTSANPENCKNGLKLPVPVQPASEFDPPFPAHSPPPFGPYTPVKPSPPEFSPPYKPDHPPPPYEPFTPDKPSPPYDPFTPVKPTPPYDPPPYEPPVPVRPPPTPPPPSSAATCFNVLSFVLSAGLFICHIGM